MTEKRATKGGKANALAAAWATDGTLVVLVARGTKFSTISLRDGRAVAEEPAVPRALRVAVLPSGAIVTMSRDGKGTLVDRGKRRAVSVSMQVCDVGVCQGVLYAAGENAALARFDEALGTWSGTGLEPVLEKAMPRGNATTRRIHSVIEGARGPIVCVHANSYRCNVLMEHDGTRWRKRAIVEARADAIAWSPDDDLVYTAGDECFTVDARGKVRALATPAEGLWSCGWLDGAGGGSLLAADLWSVCRVSRAGKIVDVLPADRGEVPHNHSLFVSGRRAAFVRGGKLHVLDGKAFAVVTL